MTSTVVSWALTVSLVGVGVYYYRPDLFQSLTQQASSAVPPQAESTVKSLAKRTKAAKKSATSKLIGEEADSASTSASENKGGKKRKIVAAPAGEEARASGATGSKTDGSKAAEDGGLGDKEFAQQLAKAQAGTNFKSKDEQKSKRKTKATKQSHAERLEPAGASTESPSATDRDADDDMTPAESPAVEPVEEVTAKSGDVSDMLEAPTPGPTTLRLTSVPDENKNKKKKPAAQPFEQVLTKKQRQSQARKEEMRLMKEESDRIHEAKKQEQLRKARTAAGTSNQTKANNFTATANAWRSDSGKAAVKAAPVENGAPLLDTFDPATKAPSQPNGAVHTEDLSATAVDSAASLKAQVGKNTASALAASGREGPAGGQNAWTADLSEEDQMELLKQQEANDTWESVTNKKSKKKGKVENDTGSETSLPVVQPAPAPIAKSQTGNKLTNGAAKRTETKTSTNRFGNIPVESTSGLMDAEWEA